MADAFLNVGLGDGCGEIRPILSRMRARAEEKGIKEKNKRVEKKDEEKKADREGLGEAEVLFAREREEATRLNEMGGRSLEMGSSAPVADQVAEALMDLMRRSESDSVRVAAAKALMDKIIQKEADDDEASGREEEERVQAIAKAGEVLASFAEAKIALGGFLAREIADASSGGVLGAREVD